MGELESPGRSFPDGRGDLISRVLAYIQVSARDQNPQLQIDAIHASGYDLLFTGKVDPVG